MAAKYFYLTFDGAPNPPGTSNILAVLHKHQVKATFFLEGRRLEVATECAGEIVKAGHDIGNHSFSHPDFDAISRDQCVEEVKKTEAILQNKLGITTSFLRPPSGKLTPELEHLFVRMGYSIVLWSYSIKDWLGPDAEAVAHRVLTQLKDNGIVVFHDHVPWVPDTLDIVIPKIKALGYILAGISSFNSTGIIK